MRRHHTLGAMRLARFASLSAAATILAFASSAHAYRPFNGTDAEVAEKDEIELELGPLGYLKQGHEHLLTAPAYVLNYGLAEDVELVMDGRGLVSLDDPPKNGVNRYTFDDSDFLIKTVLRRGVLQGGTGPSVAVEAGVLLPSIGRDQGFGSSLASIVSFRNAYGTLHLNGQFQVERDTHDRDLFGGFILEGPFDWRVRPVTELCWERDFGDTTTFSALGGAIWNVRDGLAIDAGGRIAAVDTETAYEARLGLTWTVPVF